MNCEIAQRLELAGDALQRAWKQDSQRRRPKLAGRRRIAILLAVAAAALCTGAAIASSLLKSPANEEIGMLEGYRLFEGSQPTCVSTTETSFHCTLAEPPTGMRLFDEHGNQLFDRFLDVKAETVDADRRVDGACVSVAADGRSWDCYLGDEAVSHGLISRSLLGTYLAEPSTA